MPRPGSPSSCFSGEGEGPRLGLQPPSLSGAGAEVMEGGCLAESCSSGAGLGTAGGERGLPGLAPPPSRGLPDSAQLEGALAL